jgi:regulator of sigma E protease
VTTNRVDTSSLQPPASRYLKPGDEIVAVDGERGLVADQIARVISSHRCAGAPTPSCQAVTPVSLLVRRSGRLLTLSIYPRYDPRYKRMRIGFAFAPLIHNVGPVGAAKESLNQMWYVTHRTVTTIAKLFEPKERSQIHGVVGGFTITEQRFAFNTTAALYTLAVISLSLAIINLFPFLPLDGGHVFWALAEKVRGRRIPFEVMERAGAVGFVLILILFVVGLSNDVSVLTGRGFSAR